jgi:hypothetical protein
MFSTIRDQAGAALVSAGLALLLSADQARAQTGSCPASSNGTTGSGLNGQLTSSQLQTLLQNGQSVQLTPFQLQTLLQQFQGGQAGIQGTGQLTSSQLQTLLQQLQNGQGGQLTSSQLQALLQQQNARAVQLRAMPLRRGR